MLAAAPNHSWRTAMRALRARQWWYFALLPAAPTALRLGALLDGMAIATLALAYAYGLNAQSDRATDLDAAKNPLSGVAACPPQLPALLGAIAVAALALGALLGPVVLGAVASSLAASTMYSVGPRLKALPVTGTLLNAGIFAPLLLCAPGAAPTASLQLLAAVFVALLLQNQLLHERADAEEDARSGARTTGRALGEAGAHASVALLGAGGLWVATRLAYSTATLAAAAAVVGLPTIGALIGRGDAPIRRVRHRKLALAGGAFLFLVTR